MKYLLIRNDRCFGVTETEDNIKNCNVNYGKFINGGPMLHQFGRATARAINKTNLKKFLGGHSTEEREWLLSDKDYYDVN